MSNIGSLSYLTELPRWKRVNLRNDIGKFTDDPVPEGVARWNQTWDPPMVNSRVEINLNGWNHASGTVVGYRTDGGWLMIAVRPDTRPAWHTKEMPNRTVCLFAGIELTRM
jgi:hypothetical protein